MTKCTESGCRNLEQRCLDCGRLVCSYKFPDAKTVTINEYYSGMRWISVDEALPEEGERVLTYNPKCGEGCCVDIDYRFDKDFWESQGVFSEITHWMPLPKPPKIIKEL